MSLTLLSHGQYLQVFSELDASGQAFLLANPPVIGVEEVAQIHTTVNIINSSGVTSIMQAADCTAMADCVFDNASASGINNLITIINNSSGGVEAGPTNPLIVPGSTQDLWILNDSGTDLFSMQQTGAGGYLAFMPNADFPQIMMGKPGGGASGFIDVEDGGNLMIGVLQGNPVITSSVGLRPTSDKVAYLGTVSNRWGNAYIDSIKCNEIVSVSGIPDVLDDLSDVSISSLSADDSLKYDGSNWVNSPPSYGEMYFQDNTSNTTISTINTPVKIVGTTSAGDLSSDWTHSSGRLTYTGSSDKTVHVIAMLTATRVVNPNIDCDFYIVKNGSVISKSKIQRNLKATESSISFQCITSVSQNDYLEVFVSNAQNTNNLRVEDFNIVAREIR